MKPSNISASRYQYKYLIFLAVFYFMGWAVSYPVVYKLIYIHHILESASTLLFPVSYAVADIITEVYGYKIARQVVWSGIICGAIFSVALQFVSEIPTTTSLAQEKSYQVVFGEVFRVYLSLTAASLLGNFVNIFIVSKFKIILQGRLFWLRSLCSTSIGELTFTILGGVFVWTGVKSWPTIGHLMLDAYALKVIYALIAVWPATFFVALLKRAEKIDTYDIGIDYNPFKLTTD